MAESLLEELLARRFVLCRDAVLGGPPLCSAWVQQVGITAARVPRSPLALAARAAIEEEWESDAEAECIAALARLAVAQGDLALASNMEPLVEEWMRYRGSRNVAAGDSIVECAVALASWPSVAFPRDELLAMLHDIADRSESPWAARWAKEQLGKLE